MGSSESNQGQPKSTGKKVIEFTDMEQLKKLVSSEVIVPFQKHNFQVSDLTIKAKVRNVLFPLKLKPEEQMEFLEVMRTPFLLQEIESFSVQNVQIADIVDDLTKILKNQCPNLAKITLSCCTLNDKNCLSVANNLKDKPFLNYMDIGGNVTSVESIGVIQDMFKEHEKFTLLVL